MWEKIWENWEKYESLRNTKTEPLGMPQRFRKKIKSACCMVEIIWHYFLEFLLNSISNRLLQTNLSNIFSQGNIIFWNGTKFMRTLPFLHAVISFLPILLSTVSTQGTGNVFLYERSISEYHKDVKISRVQMPYYYSGM